jgi:hypothetical protein
VPTPARAGSGRTAQAAGAGTTSIGFGPTSRSYIEAVTVCASICTDQSFFRLQRWMRKHIVITWKGRPLPLGGAGDVVIVEPSLATAVIVT